MNTATREWLAAMVKNDLCAAAAELRLLDLQPHADLVEAVAVMLEALEDN